MTRPEAPEAPAAAEPTPGPPAPPAPGPPTTPPARPSPGLLDRALGLLVSPKLALALLVVVLACCVVGVTLFREDKASAAIFSTLWFNALLVLLAVSSASAFLSRAWKRKRTAVSVGMIMFHVSFLGVLGGVVYNSLFSFRGVMRLTEGETLPNGALESYDEVEHGRFFDGSMLRGETTLVRMHVNFDVDGENKRAAYEIEVRDGAARDRRVIYVTEYYDFDGVRFFCLKEGYSVLVVLAGKNGRELGGAHVPLQSIRQADRSYLYSTGDATKAAGFPFPPAPEPPRLELEVSYYPGLVERTGQVRFQARPATADGPSGEPQTRMVAVGEPAEFGDLVLTPREIRYWVGLHVRYDPGLNAVLVSLCFGLLGMTTTFVGRLLQGRARRRAAADH